MRKIAPIIAIMAFLSPESSGQKSSPTTASDKVFLLNDSGHNEWCAYAHESSWKSQVDALGADTVATMDFSAGRLTSVDVTTQDETGDWIVFDHYAVNRSGGLRQLRRKVNILPGDRSVVEIYLIGNGHAKLQSRATTSLATSKKLTDAEDWLPDVPTITRLGDFPFGKLITVKYPEFASKQKICAPSRIAAS